MRQQCKVLSCTVRNLTCCRDVFVKNISCVTSPFLRECGGGGGKGAKTVNTSVISKDPNVDLHSKVTKPFFFFKLGMTDSEIWCCLK